MDGGLCPALVQGNDDDEMQKYLIKCSLIIIIIISWKKSIGHKPLLKNNLRNGLEPTPSTNFLQIIFF